jgi:hypothetical protein
MLPAKDNNKIFVSFAKTHFKKIATRRLQNFPYDQHLVLHVGRMGRLLHRLEVVPEGPHHRRKKEEVHREPQISGKWISRISFSVKNYQLRTAEISSHFHFISKTVNSTTVKFSICAFILDPFNFCSQLVAETKT